MKLSSVQTSVRFETSLRGNSWKESCIRSCSRSVPGITLYFVPSAGKPRRGFLGDRACRTQCNLGTQVIIVATVLTIWVLCPGMPLTKDKGRGKMLNTKQNLPPQTPWPANTPTAAITAKPATKGCKGCPVGGKLSSRVLSPTCHADIIPTAPT